MAKAGTFGSCSATRSPRSTPRLRSSEASQQAALAKAVATTRMRETVAWARELFGGNGIVLDYEIAKLFGDAEGVYSFEGTRQMNTLIVGKAITGISAFV